MRILLQHARTQLYLRSLGRWAANDGDAYDFKHSRRAIEFAREHSIKGVEVSIKFSGSERSEEFAMPIPLPQAIRATA